MTNPPVDFGRQSLHRYKEKPAAKKRVSGNEQSRTSGSQVTQGRDFGRPSLFSGCRSWWPTS